MDRWSSRIRNPVLPAFSQPVVDFFYKMFTEDFFDILADETNKYARQEIAKKLQRPGGRGDPMWVQQGETTAQEMKAFISTVIVMGINRQPTIEDYWSTHDKLGNTGLSKLMTINRWRKLCQYIHLNDNENTPAEDDPNRDRLHKVRPLIEMCNTNFKNGTYRPHQHLSIDEAMIGFKGRSYMKQYMPGKPTKWGLKSWMLADSHTGFCIHADVYTGAKQGQGVTQGLGYQVVMGLAQHVSGKNFQLFFDNYFTSIQLLQDLKTERQISATGTVRINRKGLPPKFKTKQKVIRGTTQQWQKGDIIATKWNDRKDVHLLSTNGTNARGTIARHVGNAQSEIPCPDVIKLYNKYMGGVDLNDQLRSYYQLGRKANKYWKYIMWFYIDLCLINAWILYDQSTPVKRIKKYNQKDFRLDVCAGLEAGYSSRKQRQSQTRPIIGVVDEVNIGAHRLVRLDGRKRVCKQCSRMGRKTPTNRGVETSFGCEHCQVSLCQGHCFYEFHR